MTTPSLPNPSDSSTQIRKALYPAGILAIRLIGPPGSGKTELIAATIKLMAAPRRVAVIVINPAPTRDAARLRLFGVPVETINAALPRAIDVRRALEQIPLKETDLLLIETCGGLLHMEDVGQDATVAAFAVSGGDDKAAEYHRLLTNSSLVLLTQSDLLSMVRFSQYVFRGDVQTANPTVEIIELSAVTGISMDRWLQWLQSARAEKTRRAAPEKFADSPAERFFG